MPAFAPAPALLHRRVSRRRSPARRVRSALSTPPPAHVHVVAARPQAAVLRIRRAPAAVVPMTAEVETEMLVRMAVAVGCGAIIGVERRAASANAGVRTLSLVSLGSAIFSLTSLHGLGGDPSRMGAAISTGIGFLGSGAINREKSANGSQRQLVTAASIWIAAALGVAAASGLFRLAFTGAWVTVLILRWTLFRRYLRLFYKRQFAKLKAVRAARRLADSNRKRQRL